MSVAPKLPPSLLGMTPGTLQRGDDLAPLLVRARELIEAGLRGVLLREPGLGDKDLLHLARELRSVLDACGDDGAWLGVHDSLHVALAAGADGLHLGFRSLDVRTVRDTVGSRLCVGVSTHQGDSVGLWAGADYLFHGPVFPTPSKEGLVDVIGPGTLQDFAKDLPLEARPRVFGLGGITASNAAQVVDDDGAVYGVAVRGALFESQDARANLAAMLALQKLMAASDNQGDCQG